MSSEVYETGTRPFFVEEFSDVFVDPETLKWAEPAPSHRSVVNDPCPPDDDAFALLFRIDPESGQNIETDFFKASKRQLTGQVYAPWLFESAVPDATTGAPDGKRHDAFLRHVGSAVSLLFPQREALAMEPNHVYALFLDPALQVVAAMREQDPHRDFRRELWRIVGHAWDHEFAKVEQIEVEAAAREQERLQVREGIVEGVRDWNPHLPKEEVDARSWIEPRLIIHHEDRYFVLRRNGRFDSKGVSSRGLSAQVRALGMDDWITLARVAMNGSAQVLKLAEVTHGKMTNASGVVLRPQMPEGGYLEDPRAVNPRLVVQSYARRDDLKPLWDDRVDGLLRRIGGAKYEKLIRIIGCFLAFELGAVCAIACILPPDSGKKLIQRGLVECVTTQEIVTGTDLIGGFNAGMLRTPWAFVNEGWPNMKAHFRILDVFRQLVTGDDMRMNEKYQALATGRPNMRVGLFANNKSIVLNMVRGQDLEPDDREAVAQRLTYFETGRAAHAYLRERGNTEFTKGWIAGDGGKGSDFIVARHFLKLWEMYGRDAKAGRHGLLVEGDGDDSPIMGLMRVQGGSTPVVVETLLAMLTSMGYKFDGTKGVYAKDGCFKVTVAAVLDHWRGSDSLSRTTPRLTEQGVVSALRSLVTSRSHNRINGHDGRWSEIDVPLLAGEASRIGRECPRLDELLLAVQKATSANGNGVHHAVTVGVGAGVGA